MGCTTSASITSLPSTEGTTAPLPTPPAALVPRVVEPASAKRVFPTPLALEGAPGVLTARVEVAASQPLEGYEQRVHGYLRAHRKAASSHPRAAIDFSELVDDILMIIIGYAKTDTIVVLGNSINDVLTCASFIMRMVYYE
jgi:uncharacterized heparinase superfamily protein